jgi:hypothetical protein
MGQAWVYAPEPGALVLRPRRRSGGGRAVLREWKTDAWDAGVDCRDVECGQPRCRVGSVLTPGAVISGKSIRGALIQ